MRMVSGANARGGRCSTAGANKAGRVKVRMARMKNWINSFLDLANEVVSETRAASSSRGKELGELAALKDRMKDRQCGNG